MLRRLLPTLAGLLAGLLLLAWGFVSLERIFVREREEARATLASRRRALEAYAGEALRQELAGRLAAEAPRLAAALDDPLVDATGLVYRRAGRDLLPRGSSRGAAEGPPGAPARALVERLSRGDLSRPGDGSPLDERLALLARFLRALDAGDRAGIEATFRSLLAHRARYVLPVAQDAAILLAALEKLSAASHPDPALMTALLREGLGDGHGGRMEGLERSLLARRSRLSPDDLTLLGGRVVALCRASGVRHDDFLARLAEPPAETVPIPDPLAAPSLLPGWYVAPEGDSVRGVAVDLAAILSGLTASMRRRGLLDAEGTLAARAVPVQPVESLRVVASSPAWRRAEGEADRNFRVKTGLLLVTGLLAAGIAGLSLLVEERTQRFLELKSSFVATVSHELKTPLASVRLLAETLERRVAEVPGARDYPARIVREVDRLGYLVENILSYNRLEKGRIALRRSPVRLEEVVAEVVGEVREGDVPLVVDLDGLGEVTVDGDRDLLRLLFLNLLRNACQHATRRPVEVAVTAERGRLHRVTVADNGGGIPDGERERVFEEFHRVGRTDGRRDGGSGLGLAICRRIARAHGGDIRIARSSAGGTAFELTLPEGAG